MYIENYSISMNSQYFNLEADSVEAQIKNSTNSNSSSKEIAKTTKNKMQQDFALNRLNAKLTHAILKNVNNTSVKSLGKEVEITTTHTEAQELNFQTKAFVQADQREIEIALDISLSRSFVYKNKITVSQSSLTDPLIISLDGSLPILSSHQFSFDIDSDGTSDQISLLKNRSGFLALDKNNNHKIDDGNELFGTKSGDGFSDLSKYDDDNNGWIDENDKIFDKLQVWMKTEKSDKLIALGEVGIGAIYLGTTKSPFELKSETNELLGEIKKSGIFLYEDGRAGVISQVDLAISSQENLKKAETITHDISKLKANTLYNPTKNKNTDVLSKLETMLKNLKIKLANASPDKKETIQAQIATIQAQIADILAK